MPSNSALAAVKPKRHLYYLDTYLLMQGEMLRSPHIEIV